MKGSHANCTETAELFRLFYEVEKIFYLMTHPGVNYHFLLV